MTNRKIEYWMIPPESDAEFVASMEEVLDIYTMPYDPDCPVVCWTSSPSSYSKKPGRRFPLRPNTSSVLITNMKGRGLPIFSCSRNHSRIGVRWLPG